MVVRGSERRVREKCGKDKEGPFSGEQRAWYREQQRGATGPQGRVRHLDEWKRHWGREEAGRGCRATAPEARTGVVR